MALRHAQIGEAWSVRPYKEALQTERSTALLKAGRLEVIRLVLRSGEMLPRHHVAGDITLQCIEGELRVEIEGGPRRLSAGELMYMAGGMPHAVSAELDSSALLTIVLP